MNIPYSSPQLDLLEIAVEQGFAGSWGDGHLEDTQNNWDTDDF